MIAVGKQLAKLPKVHPVMFKKYRSFADDVWQKGVIPSRDKEIIAVAVTAITKCSYCTQFHTLKAKNRGVTGKELVEGVIVATSIEAGAALLPSIPDSVFLQIGKESQVNSLKKRYPEQYEHLEELLELPFKQATEALSDKLIVLIAYASAHALRSIEYVEKIKERAIELEVTDTELNEASLIAAALRAGSTVKHVADIFEMIE